MSANKARDQLLKDRASSVSWRLGWVAFASLVIAEFGSPSLSIADDWPRWRGPHLSGISKETLKLTDWSVQPPKQLWKTEAGIGFSSLAVANGRVFTLGNSNETDTVWCLDAKTGQLVWKYQYPCSIDAKYYEGGPGSTPTVDGNSVFTFSKRGHVFAFDAATGRPLWQRNLITDHALERPEWGFAGSPLVVGSALVLNAGDFGVALEKSSGKTLWASGKGLAGYATPVPIQTRDGPAVAVFSGNALSGVRVADGKELWRLPWVERWKINAADPIPVGDALFISTFGRGTALVRPSAKDALETVWANTEMACHFNSCVLIEGHLYGIHGNTDQPRKELRCIEAATGKLKWRHEGLGLGSVTAAVDRLILFSDKGELVIAEAVADAFKPLQRIQVMGGKCWTVPVFANGRIYCRNAAGTVVALGLEN